MPDEPVAPVAPAPVPARRATDIPADAPWYIRWLAANWQLIWKEWSSWALWLIGFLGAAAEIMPMWVPDAKQVLSGPVLHWLIVACAVSAFLLKYIKQGPKP